LLLLELLEGRLLLELLLFAALFELTEELDLEEEDERE